MEFTFQASRNNSSIFDHFSRLRKPRSAGFFSSGENPKLIQDPENESSEDGGVGCFDDSRDRKIHPHPLKYVHFAGPEDSEEVILSKLFDSVSALKSAYVQLQQAHIPYESQKIRAAYQLVESELHSISELESSYTEFHGNRTAALPSLHAELEEQKKLEQLQKCASMAKDSDIQKLRSKIKLVIQRNEELENLISKTHLPDVELFRTNQDWTPQLFSKVFMLASKSIHDFTKLLIHLMKASGWDLDLAANAIFNSISYAERSHKKFAFEAFLSQKMLTCTLDECFNPYNFEKIMRFADPFEALMQEPDSGFGRFCRSRYLEAVPLKLEASFFENLDQRSFVLSGWHPRTPFYEGFVKMARRVWALQIIAHSFIPKAEIFFCERGTKFSKRYMESVVNISHQV
ncbi:uncharacterized protein LOC110037801 [Phalaenopsis equestris]|uniref:uncharacterized protein LOC110037801 n=1 Tax=Phalaenopsis equestris TaxID=78828 RepID=UPI0009E50EAB|nr:uncharacterized protein LOC110037801 [Phalaenopsis equestris]